ncbi:MAG TPA: DUF4340 domain-containing protein, partial [Thermoanaerobaculia bacterium]|nr:DUF4340 domain-containing protein [Thermoanaerobaculia bacterium]
MRPRNLAILAAAVVALGAFLWFFERDLPGSEERERRANLLLPELAGDGTGEVTGVVVEHGAERVRLVREAVAADEEAADEEVPEEERVAADLLDDDQLDDAPVVEWRFEEPAAYAGRRADAAAVDELLSALAGFAREREVDDVDPAAVGLDAPRARVVLEREDGEAIDLSLGADVPASNQLLVALAGRDGALAVDRSVYAEVTRRKPGDWRARRLFAGEREDVRRLTVEGVEGRVELVRRDDDRFHLTAGGPAGVTGAAVGEDLADAEAVDELLTALVGLTAVRFVDDPAAETVEPGLDAPRGSVTATLAGGGELRIEVGAGTDAGTTYLRVGGPGRAGDAQTVTANTPLAAAVERPAAAWPSRRVSELRPFEIERLTIRSAGTATVLERDGTEWRRDGVRIPYTPVSDLLYAVADARAEEVTSSATVRL